MQSTAFDYLKTNGSETEEDYPYKATDSICSYSASKGKVNTTGYSNVPRNSPSGLKTAIGTKGPVSVAIEADKKEFQLYQNGIFDNPDCGYKLDHGVTAVGYGTSLNTEYYIIRNSWGPDWGDGGYIKLKIVDG